MEAVELTDEVGLVVAVVETEVVGVLMSQSKNVPSTNDTCALFNAATVLAQVLSSINMPREQSTCADASLVG